MMLFGINFSVYILILAKKFKQAFRIQELWVYFGIIVLSTALIAFNIRSLYPSAYDAVHQSFFYVSSIITTTGFGYGDITNWPLFSQFILLFLMGIGGSGR
jgi:trk system potassium uptake protein TrkH